MKKFFLSFLAFLFIFTSLVFAQPMEKGQLCPVSGDKAKSGFSYDYKGKTYYFCCAHCIKDFKKNPEGFISGKLKEPNMMKS